MAGCWGWWLLLAGIGRVALAGDEGAAAGMGAEVAGGAQLVIGVNDADAADAELDGERAAGGQSRSGGEVAAVDLGAELGDELAIEGFFARRA